MPETAEVQKVMSDGSLLLTSGERVYFHGCHVQAKLSVESSRNMMLNFLREWTVGKPIRLEYDVQKRDDFGNLLAYVFLPVGGVATELFLNRHLIASGFTRLLLMPPNLLYAESLAVAEESAKEAELGMWQKQEFSGVLIRLRYRRPETGKLLLEHPGLRSDSGEVFTLWPQGESRELMERWKPMVGQSLTIIGRMRRGPIPAGPPPPYLLVENIAPVQP